MSRTRYRHLCVQCGAVYDPAKKWRCPNCQCRLTTSVEISDTRSELVRALDDTAHRGFNRLDKLTERRPVTGGCAFFAIMLAACFVLAGAIAFVRTLL